MSNDLLDLRLSYRDTTAAFEDFGKDSDTEQNWREHLGSKTILLTLYEKVVGGTQKLVDMKPHQLLSDH